MPDAARLSVVDLDPSTSSLKGEVDAHTAPTLASHYEVLPVGDDDFAIDMSAVEFMDSSGLRVIIELHQRAEQASRRLILRSPSQPVARLIEISGLSGHLHVES